MSADDLLYIMSEPATMRLASWMVFLISIAIATYFLHKCTGTQENIDDFTGTILERKFTRRFVCGKCGAAIDIHKRRPCPVCHGELFKVHSD